MNFLAILKRIFYPNTNTVKSAWSAAINSCYSSSILALNRLLFGTVWLSTPQPIGPGLAQIGIGFFYILMAFLAFRRSRIACIIILLLSVIEVLIEVLFVIVMRNEIRLSFLIVSISLVLAFGGFRGANAIFSHYKNSTSKT
ncbi:MAG: hypothetical protein MK031_06640 [Alphaproteobacteria bacterium]|nr:hypothetical protein [Alphaproteobacteria bacterium]